MAAIGSAWRSFWHTMVSNDRHASHNTATRIGQHAASGRGQRSALTSITTNADESRIDLTSPYAQDGADSGYFNKSMGSTTTSTTPYTPGMRSQQSTQLDEARSGEIQMQNFADGLPPAPPVSHSWKRIDRWTEDNYMELFDNLSEGCTQNDINELEHELDCTLPQEVRESLQFHDGQERGGLPTGIIFGAMLLDCEEIVQEWKNWRTVADEYLARNHNFDAPQVPLKAFGAAASSSSNPTPPAQAGPSSMWREELQDRQDSQPSNAIHKAYAHPAWIPLVRDWGGNNLAIDLAPGPAGKWGQVILMGRDYDCKYVVARSWSAFLATVADDMTSRKAEVNEETGELKLLEFKKQGVEPAYFDILRWRADQKYGRRSSRKQGVANGLANPGAQGSAMSPATSRRGSDSPAGRDSDRGRAPQQQRSNGKAVAHASPRGRLSNPLARVAEEAPAPVRVHTTNSSTASSSLLTTDKSGSADSGLGSDDDDVGPPAAALRKFSLEDSNKENHHGVRGGARAKGLQDSGFGEEGEMKTVEI